MKILEKAKGFLLHPNEAFSKEKNTNFEESLKYTALLLIVISALSGITVMFADITFGLITIPLKYVFLLIGTLLGGLILHVFAYIFGARNGLVQTLKAALYAGTPFYLFGWIPLPYILFAFTIWAAVLEVIGLKALQSMSTGRAILAVVLPGIILIVLIIILALFAIGFFSPAVFTGGFLQ